MRRVLLWIFVFFVQFSILRSQPIVEYPGNSLAVHIQVGNLGNSIGFQHERYSGRKVYLTWIEEFGSIRNSKEVRVTNSDRLGDAGYFKYGKINRIFTLRNMAGIGVSWAERVDRNNISLHSFFTIGPNITAVVPVYVDIFENTPTGPAKITVKYEPKIQDNSLILRNAPVSNGLSSAKLRFGISIKTGIDARWGNYKSDFKKLGCGVLADLYFSKVPIMFKNNLSSFMGFYINFAIGKRN